MKQLYFLDEEEKNRILNLHESATKRHYLGEQATNQTNLPTITDNDKTYDYQKNGDTYFFKVKPNATDNRAQKYKDGNWHQGIGKASTAIKALFDKKPNGTQTQVKPVTNTDPSKAAQVTANVAQTGVTPAGTTPAGTTPAGTTPAGTTPAKTTPAGTTPAGTTPAGTTPAGTTPGATSGVVSVNANDIIATSETGTETPAVAGTPAAEPTTQFKSGNLPKDIGFKPSTPKLT
jgi:hypothetical protein